jgi:hypothetical protein
MANSHARSSEKKTDEAVEEELVISLKLFFLLNRNLTFFALYVGTL